MRSALLLSIFLAPFAFGAATHAPGSIAAVKSESQFCFFLPPVVGGDIAEHEVDAISFCTDPSLAPGAKLFPSGFIASAHFVSTATYVQVTGLINIAAYKLSPTDEGGQYDSRGAPIGASCSGYSSFVNLVEPSGRDFCIRCCNHNADCNAGISTKGCSTVIPGDYSPGGWSSGSGGGSSVLPSSVPTPPNGVGLINAGANATATTSKNLTWPTILPNTTNTTTGVSGASSVSSSSAASAFLFGFVAVIFLLL